MEYRHNINSGTIFLGVVCTARVWISFS